MELNNIIINQIKEVLPINPSSRTIKERSKLISGIDDFCSFTWDGINMFQAFGAFIVNEKKGSLKIYNGPSFSNTYSKPQFQDGNSNLIGVQFNTQKISFVMGVYWFSMEDYRVLINFLHPYKISLLSFDFDKNYGFLCKLASIQDSPRYVVGKEGSDETNNSNLKYSQIETSDQSGYRYYTELTLNFEIVGPSCARALTEDKFQYIEGASGPQDWTYSTDGNLGKLETILKNPLDHSDDYVSDLATPFAIKISNLLLLQRTNLECKLLYTYDTANPTWTDVSIFSVSFESMQLEGQPRPTSGITLEYNSEHGILYWSTGDSRKVLSLFSIQTNGMRLIRSMNVTSFSLPGRIDNAFQPTGIKLQLLITPYDSTNARWNDATTTVTCSITGRTNVI